jgi:hypothetical protein
MKRPIPVKRSKLISDDIERDLSSKQLARVGAISFAYNNAEDKLTDLFAAATNLEDSLVLEVATRINGLDGIIAIILAGAKGLGVSDETLRLIEDTLGENGFQKLKKYREAVIHARLVSAPNAIGQTIERRAKINEVLLSQEALDALYVHLNAINLELGAIGPILFVAKAVKSTSFPVPLVELAERELPNVMAQYQDYRNQRQALPPIPAFPSESEFQEAASQWIATRITELMAPFGGLRGLRLPDPPHRSLEEVSIQLLSQVIENQKKKEPDQS